MIKSLFINIISTVIYFLFLTPIGFILKLFGKDYLDKKIVLEKKSYFK